MRLVVELVPRDVVALGEQLAELAVLGRVDSVNVPDLRQFELRSWQAALQVRSTGAGRWAAIPHLRARDCATVPEWQPARALREAGVGEVLVVTGDPPRAAAAVAGATEPATAGPARTVLGVPDPVPDGSALSTLDAIRAMKLANPDWKVYAALDPYRSGLAAERDYALRKLDAGADGFFSQPFFDLRLLEVWRELMAGTQVFWGVTSVTSERSARYWTGRNRAVLPSGFEPSLAWHRRLAREVLAFAEHHDEHVYFMPIKVGLGEWLGDLLGS